MINFGFPFSGGFQEIAVYTFVSVVFWVVPIWIAAPKLSVSRWWAIASYVSPAFLSLMFWNLAFPQFWQPTNDDIAKGMTE